MSAPIVLCFLTVRPSRLFYDFCKHLLTETYRVVIVIDDERYTIPGYDGALPIINIPSSEAEAHGYKSTVLTRNNRACSRDKALYYFNHKYEASYSYIWFIEEDVFIPTSTTITEIDKKYPYADLLSSSNGITQTLRTDWHWLHVNAQIKIPPPYAASMICAIRVSPALMLAISNYAIRHCNLFLDEAMFNTLALHAGLRTETPDELSTIVWRRDWKKSDINFAYLYHPIKSIELQYAYRLP